jgi:TM2 domain-containing membrane protein YozV
MEFVKAFDKLSALVKFILTFFFGVITGGIYRILKGRIIWGIIWFLTLGLFGIGVLIDLITVVTDNKYKILT